MLSLDVIHQIHLNNCDFFFQTEYNSKVDLQNNLKSINLSECAINVINSWVDVEGGSKEIISSLSSLVKEPETLEKCKNAVKQLQRLMSECEVLEMPVSFVHVRVLLAFIILEIP